MTCQYIYKGLTFKSELELDHYLLFNKNTSKNVFKDAVFKLKHGSDEQILIDERLEESSNEYQKAVNTKQVGKEFKEDGEPSDLDNIETNGRYKSITDLIHNLWQSKDGELHRVFPKFEPDNYWNGTPANPIGQLELYRRGQFNHENVVDQIPFVKDLLTPQGSSYAKVTDEITLQKIRERMELVWKQQALCGDLVHQIMSDFFKGQTEDKRHLYNLKGQELVQELEKKIQESYYDKTRKFCNPEIVKTTAEAAEKLLSEIKREYGEDCIIYSEKALLGQGYSGENDTFPVVGRIDLLVVSKSGKMGVLDFKCSPKEYSEFNEEKDKTKYDPAKILTFKYQLAAYRRLLKDITGSDKQIDLAVIPLKFENFRWDKNKVAFDSISFIKNQPIQKLSNTTVNDNLSNTIENNLDQIFPRSRASQNIVTGKLLVRVAENTKKLFKVKNSNKVLSDEEIKELIKEKGGIKKNKITQKWEFKEDNNTIYSESGNKTKEEAEISIFNKIKTKHEYIDNYVQNTTESLRKEIKEYEENGIEPNFQKYSTRKSNNQKDPIWIQKKLKKYLNQNRWQLVSDPNFDPILDELGILMFRNKLTGLVDIIKVSDYYDPTQKIRFATKDRTTILGTFLSDDVIKSDSNNQVLAGVGGNMELMETMITLNEIPGLFNEGGVGNIEVISPRAQKGLTATNEQLLYNFKRLCELGKIKNNFRTSNQEGTIKMVDRVSSCKELFNEIMHTSYDEGGLGKLNKDIKDQVISCISDFDDFGINPNILRQKLIDLDRSLTGNSETGFEGYQNLNRETSEIPDENTNPEYLLHRQILYAISQLSGVNLLQQIEDHAQLQVIGNGILNFKGAAGNLVDNPGTLQSKTLNTFTDQVTIAYQNTRDSVIAFNQELRKRVEALKKSKKFGLISQYGAGNQVSSLYMDMYDKSSDDLLFLNPWDYSNNLTPEERDFLKFAILKINDNRIKNFDPSRIEEEIKLDPKKYLRVPLVKGDLSSEVAVRNGWLEFIKARFAMLSPNRLMNRLKERYDVEANGLWNTQKYQKEVLDRGQFWQALNDFDATEKDEGYRLKLLGSEALGGKAYFEHNLETLLLKHTSAYKMSEELNNIFPVLRALTLHLNLQGSILNESFQHDMEYILNYIKNRIHNRSIENRDNAIEALSADVIKTMMSTASKLALAFNPKQWYQFIDGLWKDITLFYKYANDEETPFTKEGLIKGWKKVISEDLMHLGNNFTMSELLNQQYGFNDMDTNSYIDRIRTDNTGLLYHFWNVGFRFASRPDFYNRMTLFYAQMHKDGSLDAHKIVDGKLVYDWTLDKRFNIYAKYKGKDSDVPASEMKKYLEQKSMYITLSRQLVQEGAKYPDGSLFELDTNNPKPLPKAYSNRDSESFKAVSDRIYGYYSHEKRSMIHSYHVGSLFMQMNTFWSAKKNQYAQVRSYTQEGKWTDYVEVDADGNEFKYCWVQDESGDLIPRKIEKPEDDTHVPVKVWKGRPQEGIAVTVCELISAVRGNSDLTSGSGLGAAWDILYGNNINIDPEIRRLYQANIHQLIADLLIWLLVGNFMIGSLQEQVKDHIKTTGNTKLGNAVENTFLDLGTNILSMSTTDADFMESIFSRGKDWTPFAIKSTDRLSQNIFRVLTGKQDFADFMIKSYGAAKNTQPLWDYVKLETTGRKIGQRPES